MRSIKSVFSMLTAALQTILNAILAIIGVLCRFLGIAPPAMPTVPQPSTTPEDIRDEYRDAHTARIADSSYGADLGQAVHRYASTDDPGVRCAVDLSELSPAQVDWLLKLKDEDLQRLASAGPKACELAICGKRSGIVGLPAPSTAVLEVEGPHPVRNLLMERLRSARSACTDLVA